MDKESLRNILGRHKRRGLLLLFPEGRQDSFWQSLKTSAPHEPLISEIREEGHRLLKEPVPELTYSLFQIFGRTGSRLEYEKVYFERRRRLNTFAILSLLEPERADYREALHDAIWSVLNEYTWCLPAHLKNAPETRSDIEYSLKDGQEGSTRRGRTIDLFAAETGFALSEIASLTERTLPSLLRSRIYEEVFDRLFRPFLHQGPYHWERARHNWSAVCAGSIGSAALHLLDDADDLALILERVLAALECYLDGFAEDGACTEGCGYWNYGFGFFVYFADLLKRRTDGAVDLFKRDKVHRIALFQQKCFLGEETVANFSDSLPRSSVRLGLTHYLNGLYPDVEIPEAKHRAKYADDHCSRWAPAFRDLLWYNPEKRGAPWGSADYYLDRAQWLVSRHVTASGRYGFAAKGGHNAEPHNHNDIGHFILYADGETYLADLGCGEYTDKYFGPERYSYDCNGSQGHSVPVIDGRLQSAGEDRRADILEVALRPDEVVFRLDIARAYGIPALSRAVRRFVWRKTERPELLLEDAFVFSRHPGELTERFVSLIRPKTEAEDRIVLEGRRRLVIRFDGSAASPVVRPMQFRDHFGRPTVWYALDFRIRRPTPECAVAFAFQFE